jgi:hypothetical protein
MMGDVSGQVASQQEGKHHIGSMLELQASPISRAAHLQENLQVHTELMTTHLVSARLQTNKR